MTLPQVGWLFLIKGASETPVSEVHEMVNGCYVVKNK